MKNAAVIPYFAVTDPYDIVYRKSSTSTPVKPHTHNALEIYFTLTDLPDVLLGDTVSSVSKGSLIVIPPHCAHQLFNQKLTVYERYIFTVNSAWLSAIMIGHSDLVSYAESAAQPIVIALSPAQIRKLRSMMDSFMKTHSEITVASYADFFSMLSLIDSIIADGAKNTSKLSISQSQKHVNEIIAYINKHLHEPLTLDEIAEHFHLNKDYLGRLFKEHTHATIGHYIAVQRASLAQNMLSEGMSVTEVQEKLGFSSYAYFFKFFKKMTGISPSHYHK